MRYIITYKGDIEIPEMEGSSRWVNTDGNTVQEIIRDLGELSPQGRLFAIRSLTSSVTAQAHKNGQILLMESDPSQPTEKEGK